MDLREKTGRLVRQDTKPQPRQDTVVAGTRTELDGLGMEMKGGFFECIEHEELEGRGIKIY